MMDPDFKSPRWDPNPNPPSHLAIIKDAGFRWFAIITPGLKKWTHRLVPGTTSGTRPDEDQPPSYRSIPMPKSPNSTTKRPASGST